MVSTPCCFVLISTVYTNQYNNAEIYGHLTSMRLSPTAWESRPAYLSYRVDKPRIHAYLLEDILVSGRIHDSGTCSEDGWL